MSTCSVKWSNKSSSKRESWERESSKRGPSWWVVSRVVSVLAPLAPFFEISSVLRTKLNMLHKCMTFLYVFVCYSEKTAPLDCSPNSSQDNSASLSSALDINVGKTKQQNIRFRGWYNEFGGEKWVKVSKQHAKADFDFGYKKYKSQNEQTSRF